MNKKSWLTGIGLIGACALCCALPLLGGAVALGISAYFTTPLVVAIVAVVLVAAGVVMFRRFRTKGSTCMTGGCRCSSCAK